MHLVEDKGAVFSSCGKHRLMLHRTWDTSKPTVMFIGLNPSTADSDRDDPTIRRVRSMAKSWGFGSVVMMNLFTYISTDPKKLNIKDGNIFESNEILKDTGASVDTIVFAWGNFKVMGRDVEVMRMFPNAKALHLNKNGSPKHPLYVRSDVQLISYINK